MIVRYPASDWSTFFTDHRTWVDEHRDSDGVLYSLPPEHYSAAIDLYRLDDDIERAEGEFSVLCQRYNAIGFAGVRPIEYQWLLQLPPIPCEVLDQSARHGWSQKDIDYFRANPDPTAGIRERMTAAIGRLISMPAFDSERLRIRSLWTDLPASVRPKLPIRKSFCPSKDPEGPEGYVIVAAPHSVGRFFCEFDSFCDHWHLIGMCTWQLPLARSPNWTPQLAPEELLNRGGGYLETPWHFPVLAEDGLGRQLQEEHRRQAEERGVADEASWETYATFLPVYHWEYVLRNRYSSERKVRAFVTEMDAVSSQILDLSTDRVQKLRKWLRALRNGRLTSLKGSR